MTAPTYNYETQEWVDNNALREAQILDEIELLESDKGQDYANFIAVDLDDYVGLLKRLLEDKHEEVTR